MEADCALVGERVGHRDVGVRPGQPLADVEPVERERGQRQRREAGASIVHESGQGVCVGRNSATRVLGLLEHADREAGAGQARRTDQAVVAGTRDHYAYA
jgi:hypothetical protein